VKVLVVDDDPIMRRLVVRLASRHPDVVIREAEHGVDALAQIESERPDLVFTDVTMPYLDGVGLLEALRASAACRDLPVVAVSAIADKSLVLRMIDLGIEGYLLKPLDPATAAARFDDIMSRIGAHRAADVRPTPTRPTALLVDREPGYGVVVRAALGDRFEVVDHLPAAAALAWAVTHHPALLLLGQGLPMPTEQVLARTARASWECKVILITDQSTTEHAEEFDATVTRSHVPRKLAQGIEPVFATSSEDGGAFEEALRGAGRSELLVAGQQSFGILTGQESTAVEGAAPSSELRGAQVRLTRAGAAQDVVLRLSASATDLAALQTATSEDTAEALLLALGAPTAARVVHALARGGWPLTAGAPEACATDTAEDPIVSVALESEGGQRVYLALAVLDAEVGSDVVAPAA
jgi:DNA-binding NarL/FixJ family response regulator